MQKIQVGTIRLLRSALLKFILIFAIGVGLISIVLQVIPTSDFTVPITDPKSAVANVIIESTPDIKFQQQSRTTLFKDVTLLAGISHSHIQHSGEVDDIRDGLNAGACVADFDNDGWVDLFFAAGGGQTRYYGRQSWWNSHHPAIIYRNQSGSFTRLPNDTFNVSSSTTACAAYDLDNDGLSDILLASTEGIELFRNLGDFKFARQDAFSQLVTSAWVSHVSVLDINNDGLLDVHLARFVRYQKNIKNLELATGFSEQHQHHFDPLSFDGLENVLLINQGKLNFIEKTRDSGLAGRQERTVSSTALDLDHDGKVELLELNSSDQPVRSYVNKNNKFTLIESNSWPLAIKNSHYADSGQQPQDIVPLLFLSRGAGTANIAVLANAEIEKTQDIIWPSKLMQHNNIYLNYWGSVFADFNNDSKVDLAIATGGIMADSFSHQMTQASPNVCASQLNQTQTTPVFDTTFCSGEISSSRSAIRLDYNNDGKIDLLFVNNNDFPQLMGNVSNSNGNWISLDIPSNSFWSSANMTLSYNGVVQRMQPATRTALFGNHDARQHYGLGNTDKITVELTKAGKTSKQVLSANHFYRLSDNIWLTQNPPFVSSPQIELPQGDIASHVRMLMGQTISENQASKLSSELSMANSEHIAELAKLIRKYPVSDHLSLYLQWLSDQSALLQSAAAYAVAQLENEVSVRYLLPYLTSGNASHFCLVADIFAHWFEQEEAVTRAKYLAVPHLMRSLQSQSVEKVQCAAKALGYAEHQNSASAILLALEHAPQETTADLINALGKIRQKEAISFLRETVRLSPDIRVIQQSLIALVRLNDLQLDDLIQTLAVESAQNTNLYLALTALPGEVDSVVIDSKKRKQWLNYWSAKPTLSQLDSDHQREFYLRQADTHIPDDALVRLSVSGSPTMQTLVLQRRLNQVSDHTNLLSIAKQPLNEQALKRFELKLLSLEKNGDLNHLSVEQLSNLIIFLPLLSASQQHQLLQQISTLEVLQLSALQVKTLQSVLLRYGHKLSAQSKLEMINRDWLDWLIFIPFAENTLNQLGKLVNRAVAAKGEAFYSGLLLLNEPEWQFVTLKRLSAALLYHSELSEELKLRWVSTYFTVDEHSKNWLLAKIQKGHEASLNACLSANCFEWLQYKVNISSLLNTVDYNVQTKNRLASFLNVSDINLTKLNY